MEGFKPFGVPMRELDSVIMSYEEYEALRLADYEDQNQEDAATRMNICRPTFTLVYEKARKTIAKAFVEGKAIVIRGGTYITDNYWYRCDDCHETMVSDQPASQCRECDSDNITRLDDELPDEKKAVRTEE